jgi:hypothetical protein
VDLTSLWVINATAYNFGSVQIDRPPCSENVGSAADVADTFCVEIWDVGGCIVTANGADGSRSKVIRPVWV